VTPTELDELIAEGKFEKELVSVVRALEAADNPTTASTT